VSYEVVNSNGVGEVNHRVQLDDTTTIIEGKYECESVNNDEWLAQSCVYVLSATSGTLNIDFDFGMTSSGTASIRRKRAVLMKVV
jgi:hypothetical protein